MRSTAYICGAAEGCLMHRHAAQACGHADALASHALPTLPATENDLHTCSKYAQAHKAACPAVLSPRFKYSSKNDG